MFYCICSNNEDAFFICRQVWLCQSFDFDFSVAVFFRFCSIICFITASAHSSEIKRFTNAASSCVFTSCRSCCRRIFTNCFVVLRAPGGKDAICLARFMTSVRKLSCGKIAATNPVLSASLADSFFPSKSISLAGDQSTHGEDTTHSDKKYE